MESRTQLLVALVVTLVLGAFFVSAAAGAASPGSGLAAEFAEWVTGQEQADADLSARIDALEARVSALEADTPEPTTTVLATTTIPPTTTTTLPDPTTTTTEPAGELEPSGPITITQSGTVIEGRHFTGSSGNCITVMGAANVTIRNSRFTNCVKAVYALNSANVVVENITCEADMSGRGRNCVQFDKVTGGRIVGNRSINTGSTLAEDHISLYQSHGTAADPILVEGNYIEGGGPSRSGSGIMTGDVGGSYQVIRNNVLVNPGQVGIGVSGGTHVTVSGNTVISEALPWSNVGIYVWRYTGSLPCHSHTVTNNRVSWFNSSGQRNSFWDGGNCGTIVMSGNDFNYTP